MQRRRPASGRREDEEGQRRAGAVATAQIESGSVGARVGTGWEPERRVPYIRHRRARSQIGWAGPEWLGCSGLFGCTCG
jgi:hypothetical protein